MQLEGRKRRVEREIRRLEKLLDRRGCSTCVYEEDPAGVRLAKRVSSLRDELRRIDRRLEA